jgi:hypothetical protein
MNASAATAKKARAGNAADRSGPEEAFWPLPAHMKKAREFSRFFFAIHCLQVTVCETPHELNAAALHECRGTSPVQNFETP